MLKKYREQFLNSNIQIIVVDEELRVKASEDTIFSISQDSKITDFHPFFYTLSGLYEESETTQTFYCVQIEYLGKSFYLDIKTEVQPDASITIIIQDLTEHYKSVHQIKQVRNESVINFNVAQELNNQLQIQRGFKNKFLANVSHEIRTPLNSILGFLSVLENTQINREQLDIIKIIKDSSSNLVTILDDLLDISKIEAGELEVINRRFDFQEFIDTLASTYKLRTEDKRIDFKFETTGLIPQFLVGDRLRLNQILINLLENALKFTHQGSIKFRVATKSMNARRIPITFEVRDTGVGIPSNKMDTIFNSFTQLDSQGLFGGSGLGLNIVQQLTTLMGGTIDVESVHNEGSTFTFTISLGVSHNQKKEKKSKPLNKVKSKKGSAKKPRILLGEDIEINQLLMMRLFADHGAYHLDIAKNGEKVIEYLERFPYDLVILDLTMPVMDGLDAANIIKHHKNPKISKLPLVAVTARTSQEEREAAKEVGIQAYFTKPINSQELFKTIDKLLNRYKRKNKSENSQGEEE